MSTIARPPQTCAPSTCSTASTTSGSASGRPRWPSARARRRATILAEPGGPSRGLILLLGGRRGRSLVDGGREEPLGHQEAPTWIGAIAALTGGELGVRMRAETECRLARIPADRFTELALASPSVHRTIMSRIARS